MRGAADHLHQGSLQARRGHACDQDPSEEEPDKDASDSLQEPECLQLHALGVGDFERELREQALRHNHPELRELPGEHAVLREPAAEVEHGVQGFDACEGLYPEDTGAEDKGIFRLLQLPHRSVCV